MGKVSVRFFARYAELAGCTWSAVNVETPATVADVIARVREVFPGTKGLPPQPLAALNQRQVRLARDFMSTTFIPKTISILLLRVVRVLA